MGTLFSSCCLIRFWNSSESVAYLLCFILLYPNGPLNRISVCTCVLCVCLLFPDRPLLEYPFGLACFVYVVCFRVFTLLSIFLDLLAMCMSSVPGSSLTRIQFWTCMLCVCRLFPGLHFIKHIFGLACYVYVFCSWIVPYQNIVLDLRAMCMSFVSGSSPY